MKRRYTDQFPVAILRDTESHEVSYRAAAKASADSAGDYFPGLEIDRQAKRAWYRGEVPECN